MKVKDEVEKLVELADNGAEASGGEREERREMEYQLATVELHTSSLMTAERN